MNPEFRQTLNVLSHNFESANQAAQENIYTFTQLYIDPCLSGFRSCLQDCTGACFPTREESIRRRRARGRSRGRAENFFDFYDDWDEDEINGGVAAWGNDELDSLLAGQGAQSPRQPRRQRAMSYGTGSRGRAKSAIIAPNADEDPTIIPGSSYLGFLERLPWRIGQRVLRYKPSAANLQENPGGLRMADTEAEPLLEEDEEEVPKKKGHARTRSDTQNSRSTTTSLSSRGDLILSEEEEDAREIDEEFAITLGRRITNTGLSEDHSSGKTGSSGKRGGLSRRSTRTVSSKSTKEQKTPRSASQKSLTSQPISPTVDNVSTPSMQELRQEEALAEQQEEMEIVQKREAAQKLAESRSLTASEAQIPTEEVKPDAENETEPFPSMTEVSSPTLTSPPLLSPRPMSPQQQQEDKPPDPVTKSDNDHDSTPT
jgi:hypothetical protein